MSENILSSDKSITFYFKHASELLRLYGNEKLKKFNLTMSQFEALVFIGKNYYENTQITQKDIENYLNISHPTASGLLKRLKEKEFIKITVNEDDKRYRNVTLSKNGFIIEEIIKKIAKDTESIFKKFLTDEQIEDLIKILAQVYEGLKNTLQV